MSLKKPSRRRRRVFWAVVATLMLGVFGLALLWSDPPPPRHLVLASSKAAGRTAPALGGTPPEQRTRAGGRPVASTDWKRMPLPEARARLNYHRAFSAKDWSALRQGFLPVEMEDKWFIFADDEWLYFHRSWTGFCTYWARLRATPNGGEIAEAWVSQARDEYTGDFDPDDGTISQLIDQLLLPVETVQS